MKIKITQIAAQQIINIVFACVLEHKQQLNFSNICSTLINT